MRGTAVDAYELMLNSSTRVRSNSSTRVMSNSSTKVRSSRNNVRKVFLFQGLLVGVRHVSYSIHSEYCEVKY